MNSEIIWHRDARHQGSNHPDIDCPCGRILRFFYDFSHIKCPCGREYQGGLDAAGTEDEALEMPALSGNRR